MLDARCRYLYDAYTRPPVPSTSHPLPPRPRCHAFSASLSPPYMFARSFFCFVLFFQLRSATSSSSAGDGRDGAGRERGATWTRYGGVDDIHVCTSSEVDYGSTSILAFHRRFGLFARAVPIFVSVSSFTASAVVCCHVHALLSSSSSSASLSAECRPMDFFVLCSGPYAHRF